VTISEQIRQDQEAAMQTIRRVAESLPGFTFAEETCRISGTAQSLVTIDAAPDQRPELTRSDG
jgi:hypothetical protein